MLNGLTEVALAQARTFVRMVLSAKVRFIIHIYLEMSCCAMYNNSYTYADCIENTQHTVKVYAKSI